MICVRRVIDVLSDGGDGRRDQKTRSSGIEPRTVPLVVRGQRCRYLRDRFAGHSVEEANGPDAFSGRGADALDGEMRAVRRDGGLIHVPVELADLRDSLRIRSSRKL